MATNSVIAVLASVLFASAASAQSRQVSQDLASAIIVPLTRSEPYKLTSAAEGVLFDIDGDGRVERIAWTESDSTLAFLAMDRNGNGRIDNGTELFGNRTLPVATDGFEALTKMETKPGGSQGSIDLGDSLYPKLLLWEDRNHNGVSEPGELRKASEWLTEIGLGYQDHRRRDAHGNEFRYQGWAEERTAPGPNISVTGMEHFLRVVKIYDVWLEVQR